MTSQCDAYSLRIERTEWALRPVKCSQVVGVRTYVTTGGLRVGYCPQPSHEANVRGRFAEQRDPEWPGDMPEYPTPELMDAIDAYKRDLDRWGP